MFLGFVHGFFSGSRLAPACLGAGSEELLELVFERAIKAAPINPRGMCKDPDDEKFLTAAISGHAEYLVTKNKKDFPSHFSEIKIVNVRGFLQALETATRSSL
ncbi:MAG: PIN domain-containing protein [Nitrospirae bacterium]|nr:PIN domain-containing protein [Nitrospirota bacterium]